MTPSTRRWCWQLLISAFIVNGAIANHNCAFAQVTSDGTLGSESSTVTSTDSKIQIDGGATRDKNLFHSFSQFSVRTGEIVYFNNASSIQNIISRVTGSSVSQIDGLLQANASANLFLINPNGIIFGPKATLSIGGSFVATTANSMNFVDGTEFSAATPQATLLTISVPLGLQFGGNQGSIHNQSRSVNSSGNAVGLQVQSGKTLALVGGDVILRGGKLQALGGRIELGGVSGAAAVGLNELDNSLKLSFPAAQEVQRSDISLTNKAFADVASEGGGSIAINARNLNILNESNLLAGISTGLGSLGARAGDITLNATNTITLGQRSNVQNTIQANATGTGSDINITTGSLVLESGARLTTSTFGRGDGGNININAQDKVSFDGRVILATGAFNRVEPSGVGQGGNINITTSLLSVTNGAGLVTSTFGKGNAGSVNINASEVSFDGTDSNGGESGAFSLVRPTGVGRGGSINIKTESIAVTNGARLVANTFGQGDAGDVNIDAGNTVSFAGVGSKGVSGVFSRVEPSGVGQGGNIDITSTSVSITGGSELVVSSRGKGNAGNVNINASDTVLLDGGNNEYTGGVLSRVSIGGVGNGGNISIKAGLLSVQNGAEVNLSNQSSGNAGRLKVRAGSVFLDNRGQLVAETASGEGGNIQLQVQDLLLLRRNSQISTTAGTAAGSGNGGNIDIKANLIVAAPPENSDIKANAFLGQGGKVTISSQRIFGFEVRNLRDLQTLLGTNYPTQLDPINLLSSDITAISQTDPLSSGQVTIDTPSVDPSRGLANLPLELVNATGLMTQSCPGSGRGVDRGTSEFVITGRGGLPPNPDNLLSSDAVVVGLVTPAGHVENSHIPIPENSPRPTPDTVVEAQGWVIGADGKVLLTASAPTDTPQIPWLSQTSCHVPQMSQSLP